MSVKTPLPIEQQSLSQAQTLYPVSQPRKTQRIAVSPLHTLYLEEHGNPDGIPALFLHGGPGAGFKSEHLRTFDPQSFRIVIFDQRGAWR